MDLLETITALRTLPQTAAEPVIQQKLAELEQQVSLLLSEKHEAVERCRQLESQFAAKLRNIRHDAAQPLTTMQFFLDLLPSALEQEQVVASKMVNKNFWTNTYNRAQEAVKSLPKILQG